MVGRPGTADHDGRQRGGRGVDALAQEPMAVDRHAGPGLLSFCRVPGAVSLLSFSFLASSAGPFEKVGTLPIPARTGRQR